MEMNPHCRPTVCVQRVATRDNGITAAAAAATKRRSEKFNSRQSRETPPWSLRVAADKTNASHVMISGDTVALMPTALAGGSQTVHGRCRVRSADRKGFSWLKMTRNLVDLDRTILAGKIPSAGGCPGDVRTSTPHISRKGSVGDVGVTSQGARV